MADEIKPGGVEREHPGRAVFISYAHEDKGAARKLVDQLKDRGVRAWLDQDEIKVGDNIVNRIKEGLERCSSAVILLSHASMRRDRFISNEWAAIRESCWRRPDLPVVVLELEDVERPAFLREWQAFSCKADSDWNFAAEQIRRQLTTGSSAGTSAETDSTVDEDTSSRFAEIREVLARKQDKNETGREDE